MIKCAIYARYSSDLQHDRSIEDQSRNCKLFAQRRGWSVLEEHIYADRALSGSTMAGRPALQRLLNAAELKVKPFDCLLVDDTSRLSRNKVEQGQIIQDLQDCGVFIYFVSDNIDTRDEITQDVILPVYGIKDSLYCRDLAKKTKRGMEGQVLKGFNPGGRTYGYCYERVLDPSGLIDKKTQQVRSLGTRIFTDEERAKVIRQIFAMYASGYGLKSIATALTDQGITPPSPERQLQRGAKTLSWCPNAIRVMLRNPKYIGDWTWNKTVSTRKRRTGKRTYTARPREDWVEHKDPALAIVDQDIWQAVQNRFSRQSGAQRRTEIAPRRSYLLSGLLKCGICGSSLIVTSIHKGGDIDYRCSFNWQRGAKACPNNVRIKGVEIENLVIEAIKTHLLTPELIALITAEVNRIIDQHLLEQKSQFGRLSSRRQKLSQEVQNLVDVIAKSGLASATATSTIQSKELEMAELEHQISAQSDSNQGRHIQISPTTITSFLDRLSELLRSDITSARVEIGKLIGQLSAQPTEIDGKRGLLFTGKPKIDGFLGVLSGSSNLSNGGGAIWQLLDFPESLVVYMDAAKLKRA